MNKALEKDEERTIAVSYKIPFLQPSITIDLYGKRFHQVESDAHNPNSSSTPTGLALWPAGKLLSDFIACCGGAPSSVLELGCGLGLCALVSDALMIGDGVVVLSDFDDETLDYARWNIVQNCTTNCFCETLDWCQPCLPQGIKQHAPFDRVLASDVIYEMTQVWVPDLFRTAKSLMKPSGGLFILGIRRRTTSLESLQEIAKEKGLEGGRFTSNFLLDLFDNRLEIEDADVGDDGSRSLFWSAAVLVYWHTNDALGKAMAIQLCSTATENAHHLDDY